MKIKKDEVGWLLLFIAPTLILFTLFFILPILFLLASSFTNWDGIHYRTNDKRWEERNKFVRR